MNTPDCRFATNPEHHCLNRDGQPARPDSDCWAEARAAIREQALAEGRIAQPAPAQIERVAEIIASARATRRAS